MSGSENRDRTLGESRFERLMDRLDKVVGRLDRVLDGQEQNYRMLREIKQMTQAGNEATQGLFAALDQLDSDMASGFADLASYVNDLNNKISSGASSEDVAAASARVTRASQALASGFSAYRQHPDTPPVPQPVPTPDPAPVDPSSGSDVGPVSPPSDGGDAQSLRFP